MSFSAFQRMIPAAGGLFLAAACLLSTAPAAAQTPAPAPSPMTAEEWREDLDFLIKTVAEKHRHPFDTVSRAEFEEAAAELRGRIPGLADHEIIAGMAKLVAMLRDGHSRLNLPFEAWADTQSHTPTDTALRGLAFRLLPVRLYLFKDGLFVRAAGPERRELVGAKVLKIGRMTAEAALEAVKPVAAYDSEMWAKLVAPDMLRSPEVLHACGVTGSMSPVTIECEKDGRKLSVSLDPLPPGPEPAWVTWSDISGAEKPRHLRNRDKTFWLEYLPTDKALYVQVNAIQDAPGETLAAFSTRLVEAAEESRPAKVILDLRYNGGGNNYLNRALVLALVGLEDINVYGRLFTLIGRNTFSAAMSLVSALERWSETVFVGEPTGNTPSQYGDARRYKLPRSGLTVRLSSVYWRDADVNERRPWVGPDIGVEPSWAEYASGKDPVLEACLTYRAPETLGDQLLEKYRWGGISAAAAHYYKFRNSLRTATVDTEGVLLSLAERLTTEKQTSDALVILSRLVVEYPRSAAGYLALGKVQVGQGNGRSAVEALQKALELKPGDPEAREWLKKAEALGPAKK